MSKIIKLDILYFFYVGAAVVIFVGVTARLLKWPTKDLLITVGQAIEALVLGVSAIIFVEVNKDTEVATEATLYKVADVLGTIAANSGGIGGVGSGETYVNIQTGTFDGPGSTNTSNNSGQNLHDKKVAIEINTPSYAAFAEIRYQPTYFSQFNPKLFVLGANVKEYVEEEIIKPGQNEMAQRGTFEWYFQLITLIILFLTLLAQNIAFGQTNITDKKLSQKELDKLYLKQPGSEAIQKYKNNFKASWNKTFVNFTDNSTYLLAGMSFSNQAITANEYNSSFNYVISDGNASGYRPAYYAGFRVDGLYREKNNYSFQVSLHKIATTNNYKDAISLSPFLGSFSNFKADDQFLNLGMALHYKKLLAISDTSKYQFYFVIGPSLDTRLSGQSDDNLVNNNYTRFLLRGDIGIEFENKNFYTLFLHYKQGLTSFTKSPIKTNVNSFELGMIIKASDLF